MEYVGALIVVFLALAFVRWLSHGIYIHWHTAYRCKNCGHREHERGRFYWPMCPKCGSTTSETVVEVGRETFFGWQRLAKTRDADR